MIQQTKSQASEFRLIHGDCVDGMAKLSKQTIDLVVTSPPYNLGIKYGKYDDKKSGEDYLKWASSWGAQIKRILRPTGSFFLNVGASPSNPLLPLQLALEMTDHFVLQNTIHWIKSLTVETREGEQISVGHFKPISSHRFLNDCHEYIFHFTTSGSVPISRLDVGVPYADKSNISRWGHTQGNDKRCRGNNWFIPYKTIQNRKAERPHPATFPVELAEMCIKLQGGISQMTMLDPFLGIGNSALAAKSCGVKNFIGFEIDAEYVSIAKSYVFSGNQE